MTGIVEPETRRKNVYKPGRWEYGGWFAAEQKDVFAADTGPSGRPPVESPSNSVSIAASTDDPSVKGDDSRQSQEQRRLLQLQERGRELDESTPPKAQSLPAYSSTGAFEAVPSPDSGETILGPERTASPMQHGSEHGKQ